MRITCDTKDTLPLSALTEFQGGLKKRTDDDIKKIEKSIHDYGFATPFFVWKNGGKNKVLDGHGRLQALKHMAAQGEEIPALPVVYIDCPNEAAAKNLLLRIVSEYGKITEESVFEFIADIEVELEDLKLPDTTLELAVVSPDDFATDFTLEDGDQHYKEMTFQFSIRQAEIVKSVLSGITDWEEVDGNPNSNGNKLFKVVQEWAEQKK